jgi:hypothetical protein
VLLALVAVAALTPIHAVNPQDVSRLCLANALRGFAVSNDRCLDNSYAVDRASHGGHFYSDKAPGMSVLELPVVAAVDFPETPDLWIADGWELWSVRVLSAGIAFLVGAFLVGRISEGLAPGYGGASLVTFALGTLVAPFAGANLGHVAAGTLGLGALALAWRRHPAAAGLVAGLAISVEYQSAFLVVVLAVYAALRGLRALGTFALGLLPGVVLLGLYNWAAFDAPWRLSYRYVAPEFQAEQSGGFFGIHAPYAHAVREVFVGERGLLVISPVVVAAAAGLVLLGRRYRAEALACGLVVLAFVLLSCGYFDPYGGASPGPRFLVPALPFLALGLGPAFARWFLPTAALALVSVVTMTAATLIWSEAPLGSIWEALWALVNDWGASSFAQSLSSNVLRFADVGLTTAAELVALAAAIAVALALQAALATRRVTR